MLQGPCSLLNGEKPHGTPGPEAHLAPQSSRCWRQRQRPEAEEAVRSGKPTTPGSPSSHGASGPDS